jgi:hypothetical protein
MAGIDEVAAIADPVERALELGRRLEQVPVVHAHLKQLRQAAVKELKEGQGMTYAEIGRALNLHRNRVQQIYEGRSGGRRVTSRPEPATE